MPVSRNWHNYFGKNINTNESIEKSSIALNNIESTSSMDISSLINRRLTDARKKDSLRNKWTPDVSFIFPYRICGERRRKFMYSWLKKFPWLCYSLKEDSAYCVYCVLFAQECVGVNSVQSTGSFVKKEFCNWTKSLEKFQQHSGLKYHERAVLAASNFDRIMSAELKEIDRVIDVASENQAKENAERIKPIVECVLSVEDKTFLWPS
uniref:Uncharacterized protein LOC114345727 n=1 Tax=Diabrotica virgifera virgifera TaxID=50390 RepID=A0A6P7H8S0_DIAVI